MTSSPSVRATAARAYGGIELQHLAHRYFLVALGISIAIHLSILCLYYLLAAFDIDEAPPLRPKGTIIDFPPPSITWPALPQTPASAPRGPVAKNATPVPVPESPASLSAELPTQASLSSDGSAATGVGAAEGVGGDIVVEEQEEGPPPPFQPVEEFPKIVHSAVPEYPFVAARSGIEGRVVVSVWVDKQGKPRQVLIASSTSEIFNEAALEAARKYLFVPAYMNAGPVSVWVTLAFNFKLK
jgi:protein TonB